MNNTIRKYMSKLGKKGGKNRMAKMSPEMLREFVMKGVAKRKENKLKRVLTNNNTALYTQEEANKNGGQENGKQ